MEKKTHRKGENYPPHHLLVLLLGAILFSGCVKESVVSPWEIRAEGFNSGGTKMAFDGDRTASWIDGDQVRINTTTATVAVSGGTAHLEGSLNEANVYRAVYPASIATGSLTEDSVTVTLPSTYTYSEVDGKQKIDIPMAAADREFPLTFKHLTAGIVVNITNNIETSAFGSNTTDHNLYLEKIYVSSDKYSLSGTYTFDITNCNLNTKTSSNVDTLITVDLRNTTYGIALNQSKSVMVPVPPVRGDNHYTITATGYYLKGTNKLKTSIGVTMKQSEGGSLHRNTLAYAPLIITSTSTYEALDFSLEGNDVHVYTNDGMKKVIDSLRNMTSWRTKNIILEDDFDLTENSAYSNTPITHFCGTIDGKGHTLSVCLAVSTISNVNYVGLFTNPDGDITIKNLNFIHVYKSFTNSTTRTYVGSICAYSNHNIIIDSVSVSANLNSSYTIGSNSGSTTSKYYYGGVVGYINGNINISNCHSDYNGKRIVVAYTNVATATRGDLYMGQLVGFIDGTHTASVVNTDIIRAGLQGKGYTTLHAGKFVGDKASNADWIFTNSTSASNIYDNSGTVISSSSLTN